MLNDQNERQGYTIVLENIGSSTPDRQNASNMSAGDQIYKDIPITSIGLNYKPVRKESFDFSIPEKIKQMRRMYRYGGDVLTDLKDNFIRQGRFMADYEDEAPVQGTDKQYFTTYHDLNIPQLRWYFTWRKYVRMGEYRPVSSSFAYMYIYELLCGIGTSSPQETLLKLKEFDEGYCRFTTSDLRMRRNLRKWMYEYSIIHDLPQDMVIEFADKDILKRDNSLDVLKDPENHTDDEIFSALIYFADEKLQRSPAVNEEKGRKLFAGVWRFISEKKRLEGSDVFEMCFGRKISYTWYPLSNAIYVDEAPASDKDYVLNGCREYHLRDGVWEEEGYEKITFDKERFKAMVNDADRLIRKELKTGRYVTRKEKDNWAERYIEEYLIREKNKPQKAAVPELVIDFSELERIREEAITTRDSLLTEEEKAQEESAGTDLSDIGTAGTDAESGGTDVGTDRISKIGTGGTDAGTVRMSDVGSGGSDVGTVRMSDVGSGGSDDGYYEILGLIMNGREPYELIKALHLMPSIVTDRINEAFFDRVGDNILECDGDRIMLVEDYREDVEEMLID